MRISHSPRACGSLFAGILALTIGASLGAQIAALHQHYEHVSIRSGVLSNPYPIENVVYRQIISVPRNLPWLRLFFTKAVLGKGSYLRIASLADGDVMTMHQEHLEQWQYTSAYFNGNTVLLEIVAGPNTPKNFVEIDKILAGDDPATIPQTDSICGSTDDRVPSYDARVGRLDNGCTGWIIDQPLNGNDKVHLTAGHCFSGATVIEFGVPSSNANCTLVHPSSSRQFAIDSATAVYSNGGVGNDYTVFRCFPNSNTGLTTFQQQGSAFTLAGSMPAANATIRVTGFGVDGSNVTPGPNTSCTCSSSAGTGTRNQTQQTHTGPYVGTSGTAARYSVDTCGGNSGSPVTDNSTGLAIAIHTHGGCSTSSGSYNSGTAVTSIALQNAILAVSGGRPANDECANAIPVADGANTGFSTVGATTSSPAWPCGFGAADVWFSYRATCTGNVTFNTCGAGTSFDTLLQVLQGSCSSLTSLGCNDDSCGFQSSLTVSLTAGSLYYVRVGGFVGATGTFDLNITGCGAADECTGAVPLNLGRNGLFSNRTATTSSQPWTCGNNTGNDIWFRYQVPAPAIVSFDTCSPNTNLDTVMQVFSGSCGNLTLLGCNDDMGSTACPSSGLRSRVTTTVTTPQTLYVRVGGYNSNTGVFDVNVELAPANDDCANAVAVANGVNGPFSNIGATSSTPSWPCGGTTFPSADVWFTYTATCTGILTADTCSTTRTFDTKLEILSGSCGSPTSLGCNDDNCGLGSSLSVPVTQGQTYLIRVGGFGGQQGLFDLTLQCAPPNDDCANAITLHNGVNGPFQNIGATTSAPAFPCAIGGKDVWFSYTAQYSTPVTFKTCTASRTIDTVIEAFSGPCSSLQSLGCNDDFCALGSQLTVTLTQGQTYLVRVGSYSYAGRLGEGAFDVVVELGTGSGSLTTIPTGCGAMTIAASGEPHIGGTVHIALLNVQSAPFLILGFITNPTPIPICPPQPCRLGPVVSSTMFGSSLNLAIPPSASLIGVNAAFQGADFFAPGGCTNYVLTLTDTVLMVIG